VLAQPGIDRPLPAALDGWRPSGRSTPVPDDLDLIMWAQLDLERLDELANSQRSP
jgi:hypothetical protein